jgi:hypothetical protein
MPACPSKQAKNLIRHVLFLKGIRAIRRAGDTPPHTDYRTDLVAAFAALRTPFAVYPQTMKAPWPISGATACSCATLPSRSL